MHAWEYEKIKTNLERLKKIEEECKKSIDIQFDQVEQKTYEQSKKFVEFFEAKRKTRENNVDNQIALTALENSYKRSLVDNPEDEGE